MFDNALSPDMRGASGPLPVSAGAQGHALSRAQGHVLGHSARALRAAGTAGQAQALAHALRAARERTLGLIDAWVKALPGLAVPQRAELNPPLWEWGHVAWFQEWWVARNRQRGAGTACEPMHARRPSRLPQADALYDSTRVLHGTRWSLPLPGLATTLDYLADVQRDTLAWLEGNPPEAELYFGWLVLMHEAMHAEALVYMAQGLHIDLPAALVRGHRGTAADCGAGPPDRPHAQADAQIDLPAQRWTLGCGAAAASTPAPTPAPGSPDEARAWAFDNEFGTRQVELRAFRIDARPVSWSRYLPFLEATGHAPPPNLRRHGALWQQRTGSCWAAVDPHAPAVHLTAHDAEAWCRWAGRRLPSEAEWECACLTASPDVWAWGEVWEWTACHFAPFDGFVPHPYRDYSQPWFDGAHRVLRGACSATSDVLAHPCYRNFFVPARNDILAGFRSVALD